MVGIKKINEVAENMLMTKISKDSDFYDYIKSPAIMKVLLSEVIKNARQKGVFQENMAYSQFLKEADDKVDNIFGERKNLYNLSMQNAIAERAIDGVSIHGNQLCKDGVKAVETVLLGLMEQLLKINPDIDFVPENSELAKAITETLGQLEEIDKQLVTEYKLSVDKVKEEQSNIDRDGIDRGNQILFSDNEQPRRRRTMNQISNGYASEYSSQISTESLRKVPKHRRIRYVEKKENIEAAKQYELNKKKVNPKVALALALVTACISVCGFANSYREKEYEKDNKILGIEQVYELENDDATMLTNLILLSAQNNDDYNIPKEMMQNLQADGISKETFVNDVFKDLGTKVHEGKDVAGFLEEVSENLVRYKVCKAVEADILKYGDESHYKDYKDELRMENISLEFIEGEQVGDKWHIKLGDKVLFARDLTEYQIPKEIQEIIFYSRKDPNSFLKTNSYSKDDIRGLYKAANELRGKDMKVSGDKLETHVRIHDFVR